MLRSLKLQNADVDVSVRVWKGESIATGFIACSTLFLESKMVQFEELRRLTEVCCDLGALFECGRLVWMIDNSKLVYLKPFLQDCGFVQISRRVMDLGSYHVAFGIQLD